MRRTACQLETTAGELVVSNAFSGERERERKRQARTAIQYRDTRNYSLRPGYLGASGWLKNNFQPTTSSTVDNTRDQI